MRWFTSDLHLGHKNIIKYCNRPFHNLHEMNKTIIDNWNKKVSSGDTVYVVGDFAFMGVSAMSIYMNELRGDKILILGNHDGSASRSKRAGFKEVYKDFQITICNIPILVCHYPYFSKDVSGFPEEEKDRLSKRPDDNGRWLIHGHVHQLWKIKDRQINVSTDVWDFYPASEDEICEIICKQA